MTKAYFRYWGKAGQGQDKTFHLLAFHSMDVAAVGWYILDPQKPLCREMASFLGVDPFHLRKMLCFSLAIHDLGKFSDAFQRLLSFSEYENLNLPKSCDYNSKKAKHDLLGHVFFDRFLDEVGAAPLLGDSLQADGCFDGRKVKKTLTTLLNACFGHHGYPAEPGGTQLRRSQDYCSAENWGHSEEFILDVAMLFSPSFPVHWLGDKALLSKLKQLSWHLAGIAITADWLGSNGEFFEYRSNPMSLGDYWSICRSSAKHALSQTDLFKTFTPSPFISVKHHFKFEPTPLQAWAEQVPLANGSQLFILEDITGAGKTEAALTLVHRLMAAGEAEGFFFGLPSMATSNAMYHRVTNHYQNLYRYAKCKPSLVLAHSARDMDADFTESVFSADEEKNYHAGDEAAQATCNRWLADSRKKALLAPVGVGTIDQALLTVLPQKHQAIRLIGMYRKVLVFDEIHSADSYMQELIKNLMAVHVRQGGSMVLLTATLSQRQRQSLIETWQDALGAALSIPASNSFPLATHVSLEDTCSQEVGARHSVSRDVVVSFMHDFDRCVDWLVEKANAGKSVVWVRNTVKDACQAYDAVQKQLDDRHPCILFHSCFTLADRKAAEQRVLAHLGKQSTSVERRGFVVISTQVFQESLDADTDEMLSDICPIDDLIQRAGRLHRHTRDEMGRVQGGIEDYRAPPRFHIFAPLWADDPAKDWLQKAFHGTQAVYRSPAKIWLGMKVLRDLGVIRMPADARTLIESVYGPDVTVPEALIEADLLAQSEDRHKSHIAKNLLIDWDKGYSKQSNGDWLDEALEVSTRYTERDSVEVVVCRREGTKLVPQEGEYGKHVVALSTVKLDKAKYANNLVQVSESEKSDFIGRYPAAKFKQAWVPEGDLNFSYSPDRGFMDGGVSE